MLQYIEQYIINNAYARTHTYTRTYICIYISASYLKFVNIFSNILEVGVLPNCNPHRYLAYAVQQIIAQELEVERLKRASILTGIGGVSLLENTTKSEESENTKNNKDNKDNSSNSLTSTKSGKNAVSLKEVVSPLPIFFNICYTIEIYIMYCSYKQYYLYKQYSSLCKQYSSILY